METITEGSYILIVHGERRYLKKVKAGEHFSGKWGTIPYDEIIGKGFNLRYKEYSILKPTLEDMVMLGIKRETQIVYPKDSAHILIKLDLKDGSRVLEVGTGSGALTLFLSRACGPNGHVLTVEKEERHFRNAKRNLDAFLEFQNVKIVNADFLDLDIRESFDACFIDVREPWLYLRKVLEVLTDGGKLGTIVPTANQVTETLKSLEGKFESVEVKEILVRDYKTVPERLRPTDRMVAHTGYLIFGRKFVR